MATSDNFKQQNLKKNKFSKMTYTGHLKRRQFCENNLTTNGTKNDQIRLKLNQVMPEMSLSSLEK